MAQFTITIVQLSSLFRRETEFLCLFLCFNCAFSGKFLLMYTPKCSRSSRTHLGATWCTTNPTPAVSSLFNLKWYRCGLHRWGEQQQNVWRVDSLLWCSLACEILHLASAVVFRSSCIQPVTIYHSHASTWIQDHNIHQLLDSSSSPLDSAYYYRYTGRRLQRYLLCRSTNQDFGYRASFFSGTRCQDGKEAGNIALHLLDNRVETLSQP